MKLSRKNLEGKPEFRHNNYRGSFGPNKYVKTRVEITLCCDWDLLISYGRKFNRSLNKNCYDINYVADEDGIIFGIRVYYVEYSWLLFETKKLSCVIF